MTEIEQFVAEHEASLGYHNKRMETKEAVKTMSLQDLEDAILNSRSGLVTAARKAREALLKNRINYGLTAYNAAAQLGGEHTINAHERNPQYDEKGRRVI